MGAPSHPVVGVDPGLDGALALLTDGGDLLEVLDMPVVDVGGKRRVSGPLLALRLRAWAPRLVVIERVGAAPIQGRRQGTASMFAFGYGAGLLEGVCAGLGIPVTMLEPATWKRQAKVTKDKGSSRLVAQRLWPAQAGLFARVKDDGRAEAALIGLVGRAQWQRAEDSAPVAPAVAASRRPSARASGSPRQAALGLV